MKKILLNEFVIIGFASKSPGITAVMAEQLFVSLSHFLKVSCRRSTYETPISCQFFLLVLQIDKVCNTTEQRSQIRYELKRCCKFLIDTGQFLDVILSKKMPS